ncbi:hypothetical protein SeLEV6574_g02697 [Synchytrium endobioticum]|uniref:Uncharacterized protein n=1 Tax=Synchytrium endobioticum TaxID=286115 RepID=A0A507D7B7_9FUNG|nr:hypothetical protein SeLEV6574_g02697 [Synchytrium endobioticum]
MFSEPGPRRYTPAISSSNSTTNSINTASTKERLVTEEIQLLRLSSQRRLELAWDTIFAKYAYDFTNEADEIDIADGSLVVDKGHISGLGKKASFGLAFYDDGDDTLDDDEDDEDVYGDGLESLNIMDIKKNACLSHFLLNDSDEDGGHDNLKPNSNRPDSKGTDQGDTTYGDDNDEEEDCSDDSSSISDESDDDETDVISEDICPTPTPHHNLRMQQHPHNYVSHSTVDVGKPKLIDDAMDVDYDGDFEQLSTPMKKTDSPSRALHRPPVVIQPTPACYDENEFENLYSLPSPVVYIPTRTFVSTPFHRTNPTRLFDKENILNESLAKSSIFIDDTSTSMKNEIDVSSPALRKKEDLKVAIAKLGVATSLQRDMSVPTSLSTGKIRHNRMMAERANLEETVHVVVKEAEAKIKMKDARNRMKSRNSKSTQAGLTAANLLSRRVVDQVLRKRHAGYGGGIAKKQSMNIIKSSQPRTMAMKVDKPALAKQQSAIDQPLFKINAQVPEQPSRQKVIIRSRSGLGKAAQRNGFRESIIKFGGPVINTRSQAALEENDPSNGCLGPGKCTSPFCFKCVT